MIGAGAQEAVRVLHRRASYPTAALPMSPLVAEANLMAESLADGADGGSVDERSKLFDIVYE